MKIFNFTKIIILIAFFYASFFAATSTVFAQAQPIEFSGNNKDNYQCFDHLTGDPEEPTNARDTSGYWLCTCNNGSAPTGSKCGNTVCTTGTPGDPGCPAVKAVLKPPTIQQIEIWFVRIIYIIWAAVAGLSVFYLLVLGYRYMISQGDVTKITEIRQKIVYYIIGVIVVFLAIPILATVFRLLGVNQEVECYNVFKENEIGFQFFFPELCTAPELDYYCQNPTEFRGGLACQTIGEKFQCPTSGVPGAKFITFYCEVAGDSKQTWVLR